MDVDADACRSGMEMIGRCDVNICWLFTIHRNGWEDEIRPSGRRLIAAWGGIGPPHPADSGRIGTDSCGLFRPQWRGKLPLLLVIVVANAPRRLGRLGRCTPPVLISRRSLRRPPASSGVALLYNFDWPDLFSRYFCYMCNLCIRTQFAYCRRWSRAQSNLVYN